MYVYVCMYVLIRHGTCSESDRATKYADSRIGQFNLIFRLPPLPFSHPARDLFFRRLRFVTLESLSIAGRHLCPVACG